MEKRKETFQGDVMVPTHCLCEKDTAYIFEEWNFEQIEKKIKRVSIDLLKDWTTRETWQKLGWWCLMASNGVVKRRTACEKLSTENPRLSLKRIMTILTQMQHFYWLQEETLAPKYFLQNFNIRDLCICLKKLNFFWMSGLLEFKQSCNSSMVWCEILEYRCFFHFYDLIILIMNGK